MERASQDYAENHRDNYRFNEKAAFHVHLFL
ncbi:protein of unknown function [Pseudomonas mediterranea]